ncbi:sulfurtransferase complex subunit TusB [Ferrimonas sp. SCSIO 43195]|uniref:sulfurtransferase complex subunit TusB n=1 Tax=Ferrimonas sp. SCSIO 43195 TaxID=2822844 RepID=UPI0020758709|nr:sulfurtransferase complex subunit TusB [Ferrimonas sp. SCSIO 43195]USD39243.1 sulfurtransferase complex subunit TusB [Ferrimonas sp. SCSIO 43195]
MNVLHTLSQSPNDSHRHQLAIDYASAGDGLLLMQDAVVAATLSDFAKLLHDRPCYALKEDLQARGLLKRVLAPITVIDYPQFVDLTLHYDKVQAW